MWLPVSLLGPSEVLLIVLMHAIYSAYNPILDSSCPNPGELALSYNSKTLKLQSCVRFRTTIAIRRYNRHVAAAL
jgi:hypothetical protein